MAQKQKFGLGRGLGSLIPSRQNDKKEDSKQESKKDYFSSQSFQSRSLKDAEDGFRVSEVDINLIHSNQYQPRKHFKEEALEELSNSIKEHGVLQPLVVIKKDDGEYELVAGERRLRASKMADLATVPVIVREADDLDRLELALIENIQRQDLNPIEEAESYQKLNDEFGLTHAQIAKRMGKSRSAITNSLRLLDLPDYIKEAISEGRITEGHAKVLMGIKDETKRKEVFEKILNEKLSISDTSQEARGTQVKSHIRKNNQDPNLASVEDGLRSALGTKVSIRKRGKHGGQIVIDYYGEEELSDLIEKMK